MEGTLTSFSAPHLILTVEPFSSHRLWLYSNKFFLLLFTPLVAIDQNFWYERKRAEFYNSCRWTCSFASKPKVFFLVKEVIIRAMAWRSSGKLFGWKISARNFANFHFINFKSDHNVKYIGECRQIHETSEVFKLKKIQTFSYFKTSEYLYIHQVSSCVLEARNFK